MRYKINQNQSMTGILLDYSHCDHCSFSPFCLIEKGAPVKRHLHLKRKESLLLPKNKFQNLYAVQHGALKTYRTEADGKELVRGFYFTGEILGYEAIYTGQYTFSAVALTDTIVCEIPYDKFVELAYSKPALQKHTLYLISKELSSGSYLASINAEQRIASFLLDLSIRLNPKKEIQPTFELPMIRQDIGNYLGLTPETVSRIISRFQKNNLISTQHKIVRITQLDALKKIASGDL